MRATRSSTAARLAAWVVLAGITRVGGGVAAAQTGRLRVVVAVDARADEDFVARLRGQTVELPVDLIVVGRDSQDSLNVDAQVAHAEALARAQAARVVVWRVGADLQLLLATPAPPHLLTRHLGESGGPPSADPESSALIVRAAVKAILEGGSVGVPRAAVAAAVAPTTRITSADQDDAAAPLFLLALVDFRAGADGIGSSAPRGFGGHLGVGWRAFAAGVAGAVTLDRNVGTSTDQAYWRQNIGAFLDADLLQQGRVRLTAELQGGAAFINLFRTFGNVRRTHLSLGAELRCAVDIVTGARVRLPIWLGVGADYIPSVSPLTMGMDGPILWRTYKVQPRVMVGTGLVF